MIARLGDVEPRFEGDGHYVAPSAILIGRVILRQEASVWFNAVLRGDNDRIVIGRRSNVQDGAVLHTDPGLELLVGDRVTVGHRAVLHGCRVGDGALIGIGATVLNEARIGARSMVGANALVTQGASFPEGVLVLGTPARIVRDLTPAELEGLERSSDTYVDKARQYREAFGPVG